MGGAEKNKHVITQKKFILILTSHVKLLAFTWLQLWQFQLVARRSCSSFFQRDFQLCPPRQINQRKFTLWPQFNSFFFLFLFFFNGHKSRVGLFHNGACAELDKEIYSITWPGSFNLSRNPRISLLLLTLLKAFWQMFAKYDKWPPNGTFDCLWNAFSYRSPTLPLQLISFELINVPRARQPGIFHKQLNLFQFASLSEADITSASSQQIHQKCQPIIRHKNKKVLRKSTCVWHIKNACSSLRIRLKLVKIDGT